MAKPKVGDVVHHAAGNEWFLVTGKGPRGGLYGPRLRPPAKGLFGSLGVHTRVVEPDEWPPSICAAMAKYMLLGEGS